MVVKMQKFPVVLLIKILRLFFIVDVIMASTHFQNIENMKNIVIFFIYIRYFWIFFEHWNFKISYRTTDVYMLWLLVTNWGAWVKLLGEYRWQQNIASIRQPLPFPAVQSTHVHFWLHPPIPALCGRHKWMVSCSVYISAYVHFRCVIIYLDSE